MSGRNSAVNNRKYQRTTRADFYRRNPTKYLWEIAKYRAKKYGQEFTITPEDIQPQTHCPILGTELDILTNKAVNGMSLDKIDNSRGYIPGNVAIISRKANRLKGDGTIEQFKAIIKYMEQFL